MLIVAKFLMFLLISNFFVHSFETINGSIQGKKYNNRINGIYDESITNTEIENFLKKLKNSVKLNDYNQFAQLISYPCNVNKIKKIKNKLSSKKVFLKYKKQIITEKIKKVIMETSLDKLFVNYQGFMIGSGEVWFDPRKGIIAINL